MTAQKFKNKSLYDVRLTRSVELASMKFKPANSFSMTGSFLKKLIEQEGQDVIDTAIEI